MKFKIDHFALFQLRPKSTGYIRLQSNNPYDKPLIDPMFYNQPKDIKVMVEGMKTAIKLTQTRAFQRYNATLFVGPLPNCARIPINSDSYLECMAKTLMQTIYHPVGTCRMGNINDPRTVVDSQLRVKGEKN